MENKETTITMPEDKAPHLDEAYVIAKIEQIMAGSELLNKTLELLAAGPMNGEAVMGMSKMVEAREQTNKEMISFLRHIVNCKL